MVDQAATSSSDSSKPQQQVSHHPILGTTYHQDHCDANSHHTSKETKHVPHNQYPPVIILMGVSGSGKTTIGEKLGNQINHCYLEGDNFHPQANKDKMSRGEPLNDQDREPWLQALADEIDKHVDTHNPCIVACSALKQAYRRKLAGKHDTEKTVRFVLLHGSEELLMKRISARKGHYMKPNMLESQLKTLEPPASDEHIVTVEINPTPDEIVANIIKKIALTHNDSQTDDSSQRNKL